MKTKQKALLIGAGAALAAATTFGSIVWGGVVSVAATHAHYGPVEWVLKTTMRSSVQRQAADIEVPAGVDLQDPALADRAFGHYSVACTSCHGAPGVDASPWLVLNPPAEPLVDTAERWSDAELYWIVKHGIKMTGMPALGPTHSEDDLWAIAAFVRQLPDMSAQEYAEMAERHTGHGHGHGHNSMAVPAAAKEVAGADAGAGGPTAHEAPGESIGARYTPEVSPSIDVEAPPAEPARARSSRSQSRTERRRESSSPPETVQSEAVEQAPAKVSKPSHPYHHHAGQHH